MTDVVSPIDEVIEAVREVLYARRREAAERVERIKAAADAYLRAVEQDVAAQFAARIGIDSGHVSQTARAAMELREAVEAIPEIRARSEAASGSTASGPARETSPGSSVVAMVSPTLREGAMRETLPRPFTPIGPREPKFEENLSPDVENLLREVRSVPFETLSTELFRAYVEEFAARARYLQELHGGRPADEEVLGRIIRKLTAMVRERAMTGIYGLSRFHSTDWQALAERAARKRERIVAGTTSDTASTAQGLTQRIRIPDDIRAQIKEDKEDIDEPDDEEEDQEDSPLELPRLRAASRDASLVIVGGSVRNEKLERLRRKTGIDLDWVPVENNSTHTVSALERRIRDGRLCGLIVLQELIGHKHYEPLVQAARQIGLPFAYGGKAGKASIEKALKELEEQLLQREANVAGTG